MAEENGLDGSVDLSSLGSFDFAPSWAAGDKVVSGSGGGGDSHREPREPGRGRRFDGPKPQGGRPDDDDDRGRRRFDRDDRRDDRPRRRFGRDGRDEGRRPAPRREFIRPLDAEVRVLPGQKDLGGIIRKIQTGFVAYPLKQIAWFFLDHPEACHVKVTPRDPEMRFHVCKACGCSCFSDEALDAHIISEHLSDYYTAEETEVEPPSGNFGCVVKCGITGELIGPPNLHGYNSRVREMARRLGMDEAAYRARLETVHDAESVEAWRAGATKKTLYRLKTAADDSAETMLDRDQAEAEFRRNIMPQLKSLSRSSDMPLDKALKSTDLPYLFAVRDAVAKERRFPSSLFFALRGAFHHRKLEFFRANDPRGQEFVCAAKPSPLDTEHAIPELGAVVKFIEEHELCHVNELPPEMKGHLGWLVEKGHVVKYFNGLLALPGPHPKFRNQKRAESAPANAAGDARDPAREEASPAAAETVEEAKKEEPVDETSNQLAE